MINIPFTQNGLDELKKELEEKRLLRPSIIKELQRARELGDLSENGLYKATKSQLVTTDRRIRQLTYLIKNAKVSTTSGSDTIGIGNTVKLSTDGKELVYQIVGTYESDPSNGKISIESPLGKLLMGKKENDTIHLQRDKVVEFKVKKIV